VTLSAPSPKGALIGIFKPN